MTSHQQPPEELSTAERLKTTMGAVVQGIRYRYTLAGEHQTEGEAALQVDLADVERIIGGWPGPQQTSLARCSRSTAPRMRPPRPGCSGTATAPGSGPS
jgi:hypothetical protein